MNQVCTADVPTLSSFHWSREFVDFEKLCLVKDVGARAGVDQLLDVSEGENGKHTASLCEGEGGENEEWRVFHSAQETE